MTDQPASTLGARPVVRGGGRMMTVGDLKAALQEYADTDLVILSKDSEGNGFSPLASWGEASYEADTTWRGSVHEREPSDDIPPCIVLWPVN